jgi:RNA polymerase sigma-70 factor, ECF subfamily
LREYRVATGNTVEENARTDSELVKRMQEGDEEAFLQIYRRLHQDIFRFVLQMSGSRSIAEDVTQETFLFLVKDPGRFSPRRGTLSSFLYGVARNLLRRRRRQEAPLTRLEEEEILNGQDRGSGDALLDLGKKEAIQRVRRAIESLPEHYREAVVLCELHEKSYEEAAGILGCAVGTVRSRLHRARNLLVAKLYESEHPGETTGAKARRCLT